MAKSVSLYRVGLAAEEVTKVGRTVCAFRMLGRMFAKVERPEEEVAAASAVAKRKVQDTSAL